MVFSKKWLRNHPKFLLHFLIHIDVHVLMLYRKFELIPTKICIHVHIYYIYVYSTCIHVHVLSLLLNVGNSSAYK